MAVKAKEVVEPANSPEPGEKKAPAGQETLFQVESSVKTALSCLECPQAPLMVQCIDMQRVSTR